MHYVHSVCAYCRVGSIAAVTCNLSTIQTQMVSFKTRPLHQPPSSREGVSNTHRQSGHFGEDINLFSLPQILHLYHSLITVLPELSWLHVLFTHVLYLNKVSLPIDIYVYSAVIFMDTGM